MSLTKAQLDHLEKRLKEERARALGTLNRSLDESSGTTGRERSGDLSAVPTHLADLGTDMIDAEMDAANDDRVSAELAEINAALERLYRHPERFGISEATGKPIALERLDLIPWARA